MVDLLSVKVPISQTIFMDKIRLLLAPVEVKDRAAHSLLLDHQVKHAEDLVLTSRTRVSVIPTTFIKLRPPKRKRRKLWIWAVIKIIPRLVLQNYCISPKLAWIISTVLVVTLHTTIHFTATSISRIILPDNQILVFKVNQERMLLKTKVKMTLLPNTWKASITTINPAEVLVPELCLEKPIINLVNSRWEIQAMDTPTRVAWSPNTTTLWRAL